MKKLAPLYTVLWSMIRERPEETTETFGSISISPGILLLR